MENFNSTTNQEIKGQFVQREVKACATMIVEFVLRSEDSDKPFDYDEITNMNSYPEYINTFSNFSGGTENQKNEEIDRLRDLISELEDRNGNEDFNEMYSVEQAIEQITEDIEAIENLDTESKEVLEWWIVSDWLGEELEVKGEATVTDGNIRRSSVKLGKKIKSFIHILKTKNMPNTKQDSKKSQLIAIKKQYDLVNPIMKTTQSIYNEVTRKVTNDNVNNNPGLWSIEEAELFYAAKEALKKLNDCIYHKAQYIITNYNI